MSPTTTASHSNLSRPEATRLAHRVLEAIDARVLGQPSASRALLATYMAGGHALLEGIPGIGKTLLARTFAGVMGLDFQRVQFTPDLMPADVLGTNVFRSEEGRFELFRGPIFTQMLMGDEINRTPPKTQSALLEAMEERQVTIDGKRYALDDGFFVMATQNPVEHEGTYPLPEAQLDRFTARIVMDLPDAEQEVELYRHALSGEWTPWGWSEALGPVVTAEESQGLRRAAGTVHVADGLLAYLARLASATRKSQDVELAISPRGALALLALARASAILADRDFVLPDDFKAFMGPCWEHRLLLTAEAELEGLSGARLLTEIGQTVEGPTAESLAAPD